VSIATAVYDLEAVSTHAGKLYEALVELRNAAYYWRHEGLYLVANSPEWNQAINDLDAAIKRADDVLAVEE
jgi:hypothetical protein